MIKTMLDNWYKTNIEDKEYSNYLSDNIFCNDRSIYSGDGFSLNQITIYGAGDRLHTHKQPILKCPRQEDQFTVNTSNNIGNGELIYPIGLITADEVVYAGAKYDSINKLYYLYTGNSYFTMTPYSFNTSDYYSHIWYVSGQGLIFYWGVPSSYYNVRPVINLKPNTEITSGNGTASSPYIIKYN